MSSEKAAAVQALASLQTSINALTSGAPKTAVQAAYDQVITRLAQADCLGPLRRGNELPAAE